MTYFCKKCGAVVTGKFCSCCGTRATDDFTDFSKVQRRMEREARDTAYADKRFTGRDSLFAANIASLVFDIACHRLLPTHALKVDSFDRYSDYCWRKLPECRELSNLLYEQTVAVLLLGK